MRCLITGINLLILALLSSCRKEYIYQADFIFVNETKYVINYSGLLQINQFSSDTVFIGGEGAKKNENIETCCQGFLEDFQGDYSQVYIMFQDSLCLFFDENEGSTSLVNFEKKTVSQNHFQYSYRLTEEQFNDAELCN